jgi:putative oxidoreductase
MRGLMSLDPGWGITLVRLAAASTIIRTGYTKLFVLGLARVTDSMSRYGLPAPEAFAYLAAVGEFVGGLALLIGLFGRWLGLFFAIEFAVAFALVKLPGQGWAAGNLDMMLMAAGLLFLLAGPGRAAVDELWLEKPARRTPGVDEVRRAA